MVPIEYRVVGEEDYALTVSIDSRGEYVVESGTYTSEPPRKGQLGEAQEQGLIEAIKALGLPRAHPLPEGVTAFEAELTVGGLVKRPTTCFGKARSKRTRSCAP